MAKTAPTDDPIVALLAQLRAGQRTQSEFLQLLLKSRVWLLMTAQWDGRSVPDAATSVLLVSDPDSAAVENIAIFSTHERAVAFQPHAPGFQPVQIDAFMAFLGLRDGQGMIVNPRDELGFRLAPNAASQVRDGAYKVLQGMKADIPGREPGA